NGSTTQAFRWTVGDGMVGLGDLPGGAAQSTAFDVSGDGNVIVGYSLATAGPEAFRWTAAGGMAGLGDLPGGAFRSFAHGVSANGSIVVGFAESALGDEAFVWTADNGMQRLADILITRGAGGFGGWILTNAMSISDDGTTVVGTGINPDGNREAFVANIAVVPVPSAAWLLGSALGLLGFQRSRSASSRS
ncbi:MAG: PEP-CTERM sorting domain-containing protein, partial [Gammaproteobacteria bacterium]